MPDRIPLQTSGGTAGLIGKRSACRGDCIFPRTIYIVRSFLHLEPVNWLFFPHPLFSGNEEEHGRDRNPTDLRPPPFSFTMPIVPGRNVRGGAIRFPWRCPREEHPLSSSPLPGRGFDERPMLIGETGERAWNSSPSVCFP